MNEAVSCAARVGACRFSKILPFKIKGVRGKARFAIRGVYLASPSIMHGELNDKQLINT